MTTAVPPVIGIAGAGTMGAGIAQIAARAAERVLLFDASPGAAEAALGRIADGLRHQVARGRIAEKNVVQLLSRIEPATALADLAPCGLVIEAVPEEIKLKLELFVALANTLPDDAVLATNTSSISVTRIAAGTPHPDRVLGMHFFNPPPAMRLMEVVAAEQTGASALAIARAAGEAMGKRVIAADDIAGFLVNRCNRPYSLEALRLYQERVADVETIDRIMRQSGGFRMGPFELMDLIGNDVNLAVAESMTAGSYGEPRYRPSALQARLVAAGRLGRKTGRGWYTYAVDGAYRTEDPKSPGIKRPKGDGRELAIEGTLPILDELRAAATDAGWAVRSTSVDKAPWLTIVAGAPLGADTPHGARVRVLHNGSLHQLDPRAVGVHFLPPLSSARAIEWTATALSEPIAVERLETVIASLGRLSVRVGDAPGLVLGRIVAQLVNEAAFLIGEGNAVADDIDAGMALGVNHPRGPVEWCALAGTAHIVSILDALARELGEPRYRVAPELRRAAVSGRSIGAICADDTR